MKTNFTFILSGMALGAGLLLSGCVDKSDAEQSAAPSVDAVTGATCLGVKQSGEDRDAARKTVADFLKEAKVYWLVTTEGTQPRIRPLGIFQEQDGKIWFHIGKHKAGFRQLKQNPNVEIAAITPDGDWVRITGKAVCVDAPELDDAVFRNAPGLRQIYNAETGHTLGHFYIADGTAEISRDDKEVTSYRF